MNTGIAAAPPMPWVQRFSDRIRAGGTVLDIACGSGRHSRYLTTLGYRLTAIDIDTARVTTLAEELRAKYPQRDTIEIIQADLERDDWPLSGRTFDGIIVTNYLHRPHFPLLCEALAINGILLFDTFATGNEHYGRPRDPRFLLQPGELLREFGDRLQVLAYEHGAVTEPRPAVRQSLCAMRVPEA